MVVDQIIAVHVVHAGKRAPSWFLAYHPSWLIVCRGLLRFEFLHRGVEIGRSVMQTRDGFDMTAVAERAAAVQASLFDDVVHVVNERGPAVPTGLNIAGCTDVVVGARDMRAPRCPAPGDVGRHFIATLFQQREEFQKLAGIGRMHSDFEVIGCLHRHQHAVAIGIDDAVRGLRSNVPVWRPRKLDALLDVGAVTVSVVQRPSLSQIGETLFWR
jgi:hypothetical protein